MNKIRLLSRLQDFIHADAKKKREQADEIGKVIKKLENKLRKIENMLDECRDPQLSKALQLEADIIKAQIDKGHAVLEHLKNETPEK